MPSFDGESDDSTEFARHMRLLRTTQTGGTSLDLQNTPIFNTAVRNRASQLSGSSDGSTFSQYGLLGGVSPDTIGEGTNGRQPSASDPRIFYNVTSPSSVFICGSQGSGKSHSLSCLLENCLLPSDANKLPRPLTGVVFHYDTFNSDTGGTPSEAAYLSSNPAVKKIYSCLPNVVVQEFRIHDSQLNTKRMLDLMAMGSVAGDAWPLYMHTVTRILRNMRLEQQALGEDGFSYGDFKRRLTDEGLVGTQLGPLQQRLDALESFMVPDHATQTRLRSGTGKKTQIGRFAKGAKTIDTTWTPKSGRLTIVDLSCPCITDVTACSLFTICLSLFLEQESDVGRVVALDEAHKYMTGSAECETLTERLLSAIRLQRHLAARVFISTQEPTISPKLLDLCSATIVHRFTSPEWLNTLKSHLAGASKLGAGSDTDPDHNGNEALVTPTLRIGGSEDLLADIFQQIVSLRTGEALLFAPNAAIGVRLENASSEYDSDDSSVGSSSADESESTAESWRPSRDLTTFIKRNPKTGVLIAHGVETAASRERRATDVIRLGSGVLKISIRQRVTQDGGQSIMSR
ncbi:hypothetical protein MY8738_000745 [Beauveria namnaoensis]